MGMFKYPKNLPIKNTSQCDGSVSNQGPWLDLRFNGVYQPGYTVLSGSITEYNNGTASIVAQIQNTVNSNIKFNLNVLLSGRNLTGPPHFNSSGGECTTSARPDWYYYNTMGGTLTGVSGSLMNGAILNINQTSMGTPVQIGTGAAFYSTTAFQLSSWMDMTIVTQPTTGQTITNGGGGTDLYFDINCQTSCNNTPLSLCTPNILKAYNVAEIGQTCESPQRNLPLVLLLDGINYQIKPGTNARIIEYADGTLKGVMELVKNNGTLGNVDLSLGFKIELSGSQKPQAHLQVRGLLWLGVLQILAIGHFTIHLNLKCAAQALIRENIHCNKSWRSTESSIANRNRSECFK